VEVVFLDSRDLWYAKVLLPVFKHEHCKEVERIDGKRATWRINGERIPPPHDFLGHSFGAYCPLIDGGVHGEVESGAEKTKGSDLLISGMNKGSDPFLDPPTPF
jgi:hypothetical protein